MATKLIKAARFHKFGGPNVLQIDEIPKPTIKNCQVLIQVKAAGVNPVDTYFRQGARNPNLPLPHILGMDGAGIIAETGVDSKKFQVGDRVFFCKLHAESKHGSYAEYTAVDEDCVWPLLNRLSFSQGAAIGTPYLTAFRAINKAEAKKGQIMLVHGASGAVGLATVQLGHYFGLTVIGTAGTTEGMNLVKENGAKHVFCHREPNYLQKIQELGEVNIIIEMLANVNLGNDLPLLAQNGKVMIVGSRGEVKVNPRDTMAKESSVTGVMLYNNTPDETKNSMTALINGMNDGFFNPVVGKEYPFSEVAMAHDDIINSTAGSKGKIVLTID